MTVYEVDAHAHARAGFSSKNGNRAEVYTTEEQRSVVLFYGRKESVQRIFTNKYFLFTVESV
jgi:uracil DNA glycosylase